MLGSGTNAPLYNTSFCAAKPKELQEMEMLENRLAQALDLDRVGRVLEFRGEVRPSSQNRSHSQTIEQKTTWSGSEWVLGGPEHSKSS